MKVNGSGVHPQWWKEGGGFFNEIYLEGDDSLEGHLNTPADLSTRTRREIQGITKLCNLTEGSSVLDCPCGYGRHSIALAEAGSKVVGIDINTSFLQRAISRAEEMSLSNVSFLQGDMRYLGLQSEFDVVINMFYSFGFFLSEQENISTLRNFSNALKPKGRFLMHTHITLPKLLGGAIQTHDIRNLRSGKRIEIFRGYDPRTKREQGKWTIMEEGRQKRESAIYSVRVYTAEELRSLCKRTGFCSVEIVGDWNGKKYTDESPEMILVATK